MSHLFAFIGFGEAAYNIALGLKSEGVTDMVAFDVMQDSKERGELIHSRALDAGVELMPNLADAYESSKFIFSLTSPAVCVDVAKGIIPNLNPGQVYVDFNSASPQSMRKVDEIPRKQGVKFCDVGVLGMVPKKKHRTKMFLSGDGAQEFYDEWNKHNTDSRVLDAPAGGASACKMFKSVFSKGLPQILLECFVPAASYGVLDDVVGLIKDTFKKRNIEEYADEVLYRTLVHAKRRSFECGEAAATVEDLGFDASMTRATEKKLRLLAEQDYMNRIAPTESPNLREVVKILEKDMKVK